MKLTIYSETIKQLKAAILVSRYKAAALANKELLILYFNVGKLIVEKTEQGKWGDKILTQLSADLQIELPGLKGFSATNIKRMKVFYLAWCSYFVIGPTLSDQLQKKPLKNSKNNLLIISQSAKTKTQKNTSKTPISPTVSDQLGNAFFSTSFSHHIELIANTKTFSEREFYIEKIATEFWSLTTLEYHLKSKLYKKKGALLNNFKASITNDALRAKALQSFKDEYLLDFINIEDADVENERLIENEIVRNIKKFVMSLGADFAFIGNQYRVVVEKDEYFIDLLFYNRMLQCLVAFELKNGKFKPEYAGKMNFYLSALDDLLKKPHEQPAIGIILCKEKNNKIVEFSFRNLTKPMGVATYKTSSQLPAKYKKALPDAETLKKLMG
jgi:predicted nuclease of restriction endonuclease-like (RecB) superfamily